VLYLYIYIALLAVHTNQKRLAMGIGTEELSGSNIPTNADAFRLLLFFLVHGTHHIGGGQRS